MSNIQENTQTPTVQEESEEEEVCAHSWPLRLAEHAENWGSYSCLGAIPPPCPYPGLSDAVFMGPTPCQPDAPQANPASLCSGGRDWRGGEGH